MISYGLAWDLHCHAKPTKLKFVECMESSFQAGVGCPIIGCCVVTLVEGNPRGPAVPRATPTTHSTHSDICRIQAAHMDVPHLYIHPHSYTRIYVIQRYCGGQAKCWT